MTGQAAYVLWWRGLRIRETQTPNTLVSSIILVGLFQFSVSYCHLIYNIISHGIYKKSSKLRVKTEVGWKKCTPRSGKINRRRCSNEKGSTGKVHEGVSGRSGKNGNRIKVSGHLKTCSRKSKNKDYSHHSPIKKILLSSAENTGVWHKKFEGK